MCQFAQNTRDVEGDKGNLDEHTHAQSLPCQKIPQPKHLNMLNTFSSEKFSQEYI